MENKKKRIDIEEKIDIKFALNKFGLLLDDDLYIDKN